MTEGQTHFEKFDSYIPVDLNQLSNGLLAFGLITAIVIFRYFLVVAPFWFLFYFRTFSKIKSRQIYLELPGKKEQIFEIKWSLVSSVVFGLTGVLMGWLWQSGWTLVYLKFDQHSWIYFLASPLILAILHDVYFYWTHRLLHHPVLYRRYHSVHHASLRPSPWASFSFHPVESLINAMALPILILILPLHPVVILLHLTLMTLTAVNNHLGFELLPVNSQTNPFLKWIISGLHHAQHHKNFRYNYGLFFNWLDVLHETENPHYKREFSEIFKVKKI